MYDLPNTISAFVCGACAMQALMMWEMDRPWRWLAFLSTVNGLFAWVL